MVILDLFLHLVPFPLCLSFLFCILSDFSFLLLLLNQVILLWLPSRLLHLFPSAPFSGQLLLFPQHGPVPLIAGGSSFNPSVQLFLNHEVVAWHLCDAFMRNCLENTRQQQQQTLLFTMVSFFSVFFTFFLLQSLPFFSSFRLGFSFSFIRLDVDRCSPSLLLPLFPI